MGRRLRYLATGLAILGVVVYAIQKVRHSPEWQNFDAQRLVASLGQIRLPELLLAVALIYGTYLLRSLRWREFILPVKRTSVPDLLVATIMGFGAVAMFGRPGELVRPYLIARKEDLPVSGQLAVWVLERFYDLVAIILLVGVAVVFSGGGEDLGSAPALRSLRRGGILLIAGTVAGVAVLILYEKHLKTWEPKLLRTFGFLPGRSADSVRRHLVSFAHGLASVRSARALSLGALLSLMVWLAISAIFWLTLQAFGPPVDDLSFSASILVMGFAIAGSLIQLPGVGGGTQVFIIIALTELYGVPPEVATSAAIVLWAITFVSVVPTATLLSVHEGLTWRKLRMLTRGEMAAVTPVPHPQSPK